MRGPIRRPARGVEARAGGPPGGSGGTAPPPARLRDADA